MTMFRPSRRTRAIAALAVGVLAAGVVHAQRAEAQSFPSKPIRVILALSAGSAADIIPRLVYEQLGQQLGQTLIIENRPGAGGTIAANAVAKADPDGYTILAHSNGHTMAPAFFKQVEPFTEVVFRRGCVTVLRINGAPPLGAPQPPLPPVPAAPIGR